MINKYKGYIWNSYTDLSRQLNKNDRYVYHWIRDHKNKTVYDCIDYVVNKNKRRI